MALLTPVRHGDARGYFSETWSRAAFAEAGFGRDWVQDNEARSALAGTLRGLHFQAPPAEQTKLVRVLQGSIRDVVVDARTGSPAFGQPVAVDLSAQAGAQLFVPAGFLHGYITLEQDVVVAYKVDAAYSPAHDGAVFWRDPDLAIDWGELADSAVVSDKDAAAGRFADWRSPFVYAG